MMVIFDYNIRYVQRQDEDTQNVHPFLRQYTGLHRAQRVKCAGFNHVRLLLIARQFHV